MNTLAPIKLTTPQAEVVYKARLQAYEVGSTFVPEDGTRRAMALRLANLGIFGKTEDRDTFAITQATVDAWDAWYRTTGWRRDDMINAWRYE